MEFASCQIDHIIAKDVSDDLLRDLRQHFGLPDNFDLHDPHNLAPICVPCNGPAGKANTTSVAPVVRIQLDKAAKYRPAVVARVEGFGRSGKVAEHLLQVITTDLSRREAIHGATGWRISRVMWWSPAASRPRCSGTSPLRCPAWKRGTV
ncbi:hypothetical protein [Kitasatospora purpeofusca]|uniref:hypothetical protein n=1 Tax=Kitasatospora purpeofusca TaxID=67352 RepID=UPI0022532655|nr:hypothetical protein [Kitasatospora purpeofusca]MCX4758748.1 hypothetical protein [Kitasatospora purpeofusca]WSR30821.1 hypothetical protein OG715_07455 [Kitasatospora purpeofusca]